MADGITSDVRAQCAPSDGPLTAVAFYLPQFHPVAENDEWWGPGFTEWTNVAAARRMYWGHRQPNLPGELGFYDLRLPEARAAQAGLARAAGLRAFCYWHYWFGGGRTILDLPLREVVAAGEPDLPFCLAWANASWEGAASGAPGRTLVEQHYPGADDHRAHFDAVVPILSDPRYLRLDGAAVVYVMRPHEVVETGFVDVWRERAAQSGIGELYLIGQARREAPDPRTLGYDAGVYVPLLPWKSATRWGRMRERARRGLRVYDYNDVTIPWERDRLVRYPDQIPCVFPNWDNTPRSGREGWVLEHATPDRFGARLCHALSTIDRATNPHGLVFVKSWNEWAEGNYLEPDRTFGRRWLDAAAGELTRHQTSTRREDVDPGAVR